jgi:cytochrome o ubiquinol oxidase subunit 3
LRRSSRVRGAGKQRCGGPSGHDIFELPVLGETALLLFSSITYGFAMLSFYKGNKQGCWAGWPDLPVRPGLHRHGNQRVPPADLRGYGPSRSGFLSAFFTLVGTHGLHVTSGLIWMAMMMYQVNKHGLTPTNKTRLSCLSLFWHFLDVVWICVFTVVYLMGTL